MKERKPRMHSWVLAELRPTGDGSWVLCPLISGLSEGTAHARAADANVPGGHLLVVASGFHRTVRFYGALDGMALNLAGAFRRRLEHWLDWLRALGLVRFGQMWAFDRPQVIAPPWSLGLKTLSDPTPWFDGSGGARTSAGWDRHESAPESSLDGLLRYLGCQNEFWDVAQEHSERLADRCRVPLFDEVPALLLRPGERVCSLLVDSSLGTWPVIGAVRVVRVDARGVPHVRDLPVDRFGLGWTQHVQLHEVNFDPAYPVAERHSLCKGFVAVRVGLERLLEDAAGLPEEYCPHRTPAARQLAQSWASRLMPVLEERLSDLEVSLTRSLFPFDGRLRPPAAVFYMAGPACEVVQRRRMQALEAAPGLLTELSEGRLPQTADAIDAGQPLWRVLARELDVPVWVARRAAAYDDLGSPKRLSTSEIAEILGALGPHTPTPDGTQLARLHVVSRYQFPSDSANQFISVRGRRFLRSVGRTATVSDWVVALEEAERLLDDEFRYRVDDYWDLAERTVAETLRALAPAQLCGLDAEAVASAWLAGQTSTELVHAASRWLDLKWNREPEPRNAHLAPPLAEQSVMPLFAPLGCIDTRVDIEVLHSAERLRQESEQMQHCVRSYWMAVASYATLVVSLHGGNDGVQDATASLTLSNAGHWIVKEVAGPRNLKLPTTSPLHRTAEWLCDWLVQQRSELNAEPLRAYAEAARASSRLTMLTIGHDAPMQRMPEALQRVLMTCFPGSGPVDDRILKAVAKMQRDLKQSSVGSSGPTATDHAPRPKAEAAWAQSGAS